MNKSQKRIKQTTSDDGKLYSGIRYFFGFTARHFSKRSNFSKRHESAQEIDYSQFQRIQQYGAWGEFCYFFIDFNHSRIFDFITIIN